METSYLAWCDRAIVGVFERLRSVFSNTASKQKARREVPTDAPGGPVLGEQPTPRRLERRLRKRQNVRPGTRVLIIDDSKTIVVTLKKMLRSAGYVVLEGSDAENGVDLARSERPGLIFLDIILPGMNGFAALRILRRDPLTRDIPVIMISGNAQATEQYYAHRIGADDFMKKPFSRFEVFARIECLLDADLVPRRWGTAAGESVRAGVDWDVGDPGDA